MTSPRQVAVRLYTRFDKRYCHVSAAMIGEAHIAIGARLRIDLLPGDTGNIEGQWMWPARPAASRTLRRLDTRQEVRFPLSKIPHGSWCFKPTLIDRHGRPCETTLVQTHVPDRPEWFGSSAGVSRKVPPPWTPLQTKADRGQYRISCFGREHVLDRTSIVRSIRSLDQSLLAAPVRLTGRMNGRDIRWTRCALRCIDRAKDQAVFAQTMRCGPLTLDAQIEIEFDGMMRFDWRLSATKQVELDRLTIDIPLRGDGVNLFYQWRGKYNSGDDRAMGVLPRTAVRKGFRPYIWLGNETRGLGWFAESNANWFNADPDRAIEIRRRKDRVNLRLNLVSKPVRIVGKAGHTTDQRPAPVDALRYTFGLQATPVKPVEQDAWDYRCFCLQQDSPGCGGKLRLTKKLLDKLEAGGVRTVIVFEHWTDLESHYKTTHAKALRKIVDDCHARGMQVLFYFGFLLSERAPEFAAHGEIALMRPKTGWSVFNYPPQPHQVAWRVCLNSAWQDFVPHGIAETMDRFGIDGVYLDGTAHAFACRNLAHGCGALHRDGAIAPQFPIFAVRSAMRRLYTAVKSRNRTGQVNTHNSGDMVMPALGFSTSTWDGEQFAGLKAGADTEQFLPLDTFRSEFMGRQWGMPAELLCYVNKPLKFRQAWALSIVHDVPVRAMLAAQDETDLDLNTAIWNAMDTFGRKQATFHGYWDNAKLVRVTPHRSLASVYDHPGNGQLVAVSNLDRKAQVVNIRLAKGAAAVNAITGSAIPMRRKTVSLRLKALDFALIHVT